jgi:C1A family cysteine protease
MKKQSFTSMVVLLLFFSMTAFAQPDDLSGFKMKGTNPVQVRIDKLISSTSGLNPFSQESGAIYGLSVSGKVTFTDDNGELKIILTDRNHREYLVYEMYSLLAVNKEVVFNDLCEETSLLEGIVPAELRIELKNAELQLDGLAMATGVPAGLNVATTKREIHQAQNNAKIKALNRNLKEKGQLWMAGNTEVSALTWAEKKQLYGQSKFPSGIEFYCGGILQTGSQLKSAAASPMVDKWDWRNRHGKLWISPVKNQGGCGSCWAFAVTGATEAQVNLYYNQLLNLDLSEQDVLSCSGAGTCSGGWPDQSLDYIASTGIVDEAAFPYTATNQLCSYKSSTPSQLIKIAGRVDFGSGAWPAEEDGLKKMIIKYGPLSGGIYNWSHAIVLAGWQVVKQGDTFFTRDLDLNTNWITVPAGSPLIGTTVWIFKNSWGAGWGDAGYVYVQTSMSNVGWTHALLNPIQSLKKTYTVSYGDSDGDGYYWWGLGPKPAACPGPDTADGDDSNPNLGPLDANGYCIVLGNAPVASFSADKTTLDKGGSVNFTDLSTNAPASWSWSFEGGTPAVSSAQNPVVTYSTPGIYDVSLTVSNANGTSSKTIADYITVNDVVPDYCASHGNATREWISKVTLNTVTSSTVSSGTAGYQYVTGTTFNVNKGTCSMSLTPAYSSKTANAEAFSVWIDFNQDLDFSDAGEQVLTATRIKAAFSKNITIPGTALTGPTRMRVSMQRNTLPTSCLIFTTGEVKDFTINIGATASDYASNQIAGRELPGRMRIYPNPVGEKLTIELEQVNEGDQVSIFNVQGILISKRNVGANITRLDVSGLNPGIYLLEVNNGANRFMDKFIKY